MKKLLVVLAVLGAGLSVAAYRLSGPRPVPSDEFATQPIEFGTIAETVSASATLQPRDAVAVGTDLAGRVVQVVAELHQAVTAGQPLLQLDDRLARLRVEQAQVAVELARADVKRAEAGRDAAGVGLRRGRELVDRVGMKSDVDQAEAQLKAAEAAVAVAEVKVREAQVGLKLAEHGLDLTTVRSPVAGVVIDRGVTSGQQIGPPLSAHLFTIAPDLARMQAVAQVAEADVGRLRVGLSAMFTVNAYPDAPPFSGAVSRLHAVPTSVQGAVYYPVVIEAVNQRDAATGEWQMRPGMPAAVDFILRRHEHVCKLPVSALGVTAEPAKLGEAARVKLARWQARSDRAGWQQVWTLDADRRPWPLFVKLDGTNAAGEPGLQDAQFREVLAWDPDETAPSPTVGEPPRVLTAPPAGREERPGLKLF
jgi:HlyD family secretion protein